MKITAVITTFNRPVHTREAIESVLAQTRAADEIIVVDDGSTDDTPTTLKEFGKNIYVIRQPNGGVSAARNAGIRAAAGEWIAFLDSDDLWLPDKLEAQVNALEDHTGDGFRIIHTDEKWLKDGKHKNPRLKHAKQSGWMYEKCLPLCAISPSSVMIHRAVFEETELFDEDLPACEDYDMWLRICARDPVLLVDRKLIVKRAGDWPALSAQHSLDKYRVMALHKILEEDILSSEQRAATLETLAGKERIYEAGRRKRQ